MAENTPPEIQVDGGGKNKLMAALSYIGPLVIVSYITSKDDPFVKFHIKQGLLVLILWAIVWVGGSALWWLGTWGLWGVWGLIRLAITILAIIGIVYVFQGKEKPLPLIGGYAKYLNF